MQRTASTWSTAASPGAIIVQPPGQHHHPPRTTSRPALRRNRASGRQPKREHRLSEVQGAVGGEAGGVAPSAGIADESRKVVARRQNSALGGGRWLS